MKEEKLEREDLKGVFAKSMAGHDKNAYYIIWDWDADAVLLVNGRNRGIGNPKKKKRKHVQIHRNQPVCSGRTDPEIRKAIQEYQRSKNGGEYVKG